MEHDLRRWMRLVETDLPPPDGADDEWHEAVADRNWTEALDNSGTAEQVIYVLRLSGAQQHKLGDNPAAAPVWVFGDKILEWDGRETYPRPEAIDQWLYDVDIDTYFVNYEDRFNDAFWQQPQPLYHETPPKNVGQIEKTGLGAAKITRGINNRSVGAAIFTTTEPENAAMGHYGGFVFEIDTERMRTDGFRPYVSLEPPVAEKQYREALAHQLGAEGFYFEVESGIQEDTVIIHGNVPPQYLLKQE